jgi:energy-coupling factor transporter ATP-binding protein EcfA2
MSCQEIHGKSLWEEIVENGADHKANSELSKTSNDELLHTDIEVRSTELTDEYVAVHEKLSPPVLDEIDDPTPVEPSTSDEGVSSSITTKRRTPSSAKFPLNITEEYQLALDRHGKPHLILVSKNGGKRALAIGGRESNNLIRKHAIEAGSRCKKADITEVNDFLVSLAEEVNFEVPIWYRIAALEDGVEIAIGDKKDTRARIRASSVEVLEGCSETIMRSSPIMSALPDIVDVGDLYCLRKYLNISDEDLILLIAWITYTLAHPKQPSTNYVFLNINGDQGSGKSTLCKLLMRLIDPNVVGIQSCPSKVNDLAIASQMSHLLAFDNMRSFSATFSDALCMCATGAAMSMRALYTNSDMNVHQIHGALIFNGIHQFISQPDLAQRCLTIRTQTIAENERQQESVMMSELEKDLPQIFRGLLDLISNIFKYLPTAKVKHPERMLDLCYWLAAMEMAEGVQAGSYQKLYSDSLKQTQLDSLMEHTLAAALLEFVSKMHKAEWKGTPAKLLAELSVMESSGSQYSRDFPQNPISLSKRLNGLKASFETLGIEVHLSRGKLRTITIINVSAYK